MSLLVERIERRLRTEDRGHATPCMIYGGCLNKGYGQIGTPDPSARCGVRTYAAHRLMYEHYVGPIPVGLQIDHLCRQPACCNPAHLEPVTGAENRRRAAALTTCCPRGHAYSEANTYVHIDVNGWVHRYCRECQRIKAQRLRDQALGLALDGVDGHLTPGGSA